jgi:hypothetical protein
MALAQDEFAAAIGDGGGLQAADGTEHLSRTVDARANRRRKLSSSYRRRQKSERSESNACNDDANSNANLQGQVSKDELQVESNILPHNTLQMKDSEPTNHQLPNASDRLQSIASAPLISSSDTTLSPNINILDLDESMDTSKLVAVGAASALPNQMEVIEIDDSESENDVEIVESNTSVKRKHFFPEDNVPDQSPYAKEAKRQAIEAEEPKQATTSYASSQHFIDYPYSDRSSAYIQHIAEACTLIMTDVRWRTCTKISCTCQSQCGVGSGCTGKTLLSWENGDDLSAVKAFMSLCNEDDPASCPDKVSTETDDETEAFERAMHLYSRMFHRKGPWFDLTDLYLRYYAPKKSKSKQSTDESELPEDGTETCETNQDDSNEKPNSDNIDPTKNATPIINDFFTPKSGGIATAATSRSSKTTLSQHRSALQLLFTDIIRLLSMGLIRTFDSEYECGSVAGNVSAGSRRGTFLLADERREVLRRLGGGGDKGDNEILAQMQKQQSMRSSFSSSATTQTNTQTMLPVRKHVDHVLTRKLASKVALLASGYGSTTSKPRKGDFDDANDIIQTAWNEASKTSISNGYAKPSKQIMTTLRLREAPLTSLRRALRLFLCACGGPGNMRGDGTNGWIHVPTIGSSPKIQDQWHNVVYPGLSSRLGITSYDLKHCYKKLSVESMHSSDSSATTMMRVFRHVSHFRMFELGVELRSFIDRAIEAYETDRSNQRRQQTSEKEKSTRIETWPWKVHDQFEVLTTEGRRKITHHLLSSCYIGNQTSNVLECIKCDINSLHCDKENRDDGLANDIERMIVGVAIICHRVLQNRMLNSSQDLDYLVSKPWLRHFSIDSILVYILWDCIPLLERNGRYSLAISFLATILLGSAHTHVDIEVDEITELVNSDVKPYVQFLLPRRNRGKAFDRLIIDLTHRERARKKYDKAEMKKAKNEKQHGLTPIQQLCKAIICSVSVTTSIPFCSIRNLARRLKVPLRATMKSIMNDEMELLGIRLDNDEDAGESKTSGYCDWTPTTDYAVANALSSDTSTAGKRCSFVGWEDVNGDVAEPMRSLNVEELALAEYNQGRLPADGSLTSGGVSGGFVGWHCEGSHIRAIFRILCLDDLLGQSPNNDDIFLSPYQSSPYDLHVGMQSVKRSSSQIGVSSLTPARGFFERRHDTIEQFLHRLAHLDPQSICDSIYNAIQKRWQQHKDLHSIVKDESLQSDVAELRSLSCVAAGLGGKTLASIFRSMCFDYRHYCGGLPDLLLIRARFVKTRDSPTSLVDLGEWIGESFSKENIEQGSIQAGLNMLRDDEFLGCSKNGDSVGTQRNSSRKSTPIEPITVMPRKLSLRHSEKDVVVDTVLVEVKSANDRLDARQEDWLNILGTNGRVCKFESKKDMKK